MHRIQVRSSGGRSELFDRITGRSFVLRGYNYVQLADLRKLPGNQILRYHSVFNIGRFGKSAAAGALKQMAADGCNTVRVFLNAITEGGMLSSSLTKPSAAYLDNVVAFLKLARRQNLYVILTLDGFTMPQPAARLDPILGLDYQSTNFQVLSPEGLRANCSMFATLARELIRRGAPLESILAYELRNELSFEPDLPPLSLNSGIARTANGSSYNLSVPSQKERMLDEGLVYWIDRVRSSIREVDPTALVTVGLIPPATPHPMRLGEKRLSVTSGAIRKSSADFIDIHVYPQADGMTFREFAENFDLVGVRNKPIVMGEFGALATAFPSAEDAAESMVAWQNASSEYGIQGWLFWAWGAYPGRDMWTALDSNAVIGKALAPKLRPAPSTPAGTTILRYNAARRSVVRASRTMEGSRPDYATDGTTAPWNAGDGPPQWIEVDLGRPELVRGVRLVASQTPAGPTFHQVWLRGPDEEYRLAHEFRGNTKDFQVLQCFFRDPVSAQVIRIVTLTSPSWVGWREIQVLRAKPR